MYEMKVIRAKFPEETKKEFKEIANKQGETEASLCRRVIMNYVQEVKSKGQKPTAARL